LKQIKDRLSLYRPGDPNNHSANKNFLDNIEEDLKFLFDLIDARDHEIYYLETQVDDLQFNQN